MDAMEVFLEYASHFDSEGNGRIKLKIVRAIALLFSS